MAEALATAIPADIERMAQDVLTLTSNRQIMLATAESCTGGLLASLLTDIPGKSHTFERGFVTCTDEAKHELLGVPLSILGQAGAVSEAAARAMAEGALARSRADLAVSITGYTDSGPGQVGGLVHFACARHGRPTRHRCERFGRVGRAEVRLSALRVTLRLLRDELYGLAEAA